MQSRGPDFILPQTLLREHIIWNAQNRRQPSDEHTHVFRHYESLVAPSEQASAAFDDGSAQLHSAARPNLHIRDYNDDPLMHWMSYIDYYEKSFPFDKEVPLLLMERCTWALAHIPGYMGDDRFESICFSYARQTRAPFKTMKMLIERRGTAGTPCTGGTGRKRERTVQNAFHASSPFQAPEPNMGDSQIQQPIQDAHHQDSKPAALPTNQARDKHHKVANQGGSKTQHVAIPNVPKESSKAAYPAMARLVGKSRPRVIDLLDSDDDKEDDEEFPDTSMVKVDPQPESTALTLYIAKDHEKLTEKMIFLRQQIEVFRATPDDLRSRTHHNFKPISVGQVGVRCRHCSHLPAVRQSEIFPLNLVGIYQAAAKISNEHFESGLCSALPSGVKNRFSSSAPRQRSASGTQKYWVDAAKLLGLVDTDDGIRFSADAHRTGESKNEAAR